MVDFNGKLINFIGLFNFSERVLSYAPFSFSQFFFLAIMLVKKMLPKKGVRPSKCLD